MIVLVHISQRLRPLIACGAAVALLAAPTAQADRWGAGAAAANGQSCGQLDPWAYRLVCSGSSRASIPLVTEHSAGQNAIGTDRATRVATSNGSSALVVAKSSGFDWRDATIGAATTLGLVLFAGCAGTFALRKRRTIAPS